MPVTALTAAQQRMINDYIPSLSAGHPPSFALGDKLDDIIVQANLNERTVDALISGTANVANGATNAGVGNFPGLDGVPVVVAFADDFSASASRACGYNWDGADNLQVNVDADPATGGGVNISYIIDGR